MSVPFKDKQTRITIFQDWNIIAPMLKTAMGNILEQTKPEQIRRAEELINDAELLHLNITSFLVSKRALTQRVNSHKNSLQRLHQQVYELNSNRSQDISDQDNTVNRMRDILKQLYRELRRGRVLERQIVQFFQNANLANYNPHVHQLRFSNNKETEQILMTKMEQIQKSSRSLFRSIHYSDQNLSAVFSREENLNFCFNTLQQLVCHDSMVRIHANMICQLKEVDELRDDLYSTNRATEAEYAKYELVYDCLTLMKNQKEEIQKEKVLLEDTFNKATHYVPVADGYYSQNSRLGQEESVMHQKMGQGNDSQNLIETNLKVYRTNLGNFTRVSAQTSLYCYAFRQAQFVECLSDFEKFFQRWKRNHNHLAFLYEQRNNLQNIKSQQRVRGSYSESNRQHLISSYQSVRNRQIPQDYSLESYKRNLLTDFEKELQAQRISFNQRQIRKEDVKGILARQTDFFQRLKGIETRQKIRFIRSNKQNIDKLIFQIQQLELHSNRGESYHSQTALYGSALDFCKIIALNQKYEEQHFQFNELMLKGRTYRELPHGMTDVVLAYVHDLNIMLKAQSESHEFGGSHLQQFWDAVENTIRAKPRIKIDEAVEINMYLLGDAWLSLHSHFYRHLTPLGEELMLDQLLEVGEDIGRGIHQAVLKVSQIPEIMTRSMDIDRSFFYSYRVLLALVEMTFQGLPADVQKFRILNLDAVLEATYQYLDTFFLEKKAIYRASDVVKLTLLEYFFSKVYKDSEHARTIRVVRLQVYLHFMAELYVENFQNELIRSNWIQPLIGIHFRMDSISNRASAITDRRLAQQVYSLIQSLKKFPLTITNKHDIVGFQTALRTGELIPELQHALNDGKEDISMAAIARLTLQAVEEAQVMVQTQFDVHENVVIKRKKEACLSFQEIQRIIEGDIRQIREKEPLTMHFGNSQSTITLNEGTRKLLY